MNQANISLALRYLRDARYLLAQASNQSLAFVSLIDRIDDAIQFVQTVEAEGD